MRLTTTILGLLVTTIDNLRETEASIIETIADGSTNPEWIAEELRESVAEHRRALSACSRLAFKPADYLLA